MKYRLNKAENAPFRINNVAKTKVIRGRKVVTYNNYITLAPDKVYTTDDEKMIEFFKGYRRTERYSEKLENALKAYHVPYEIKYCKSCSGRIRKISYQVVEVIDE